MGRLLSGVQDTRDAGPEGAGLGPTAVGQGRIVGGRRGEMPFLVDRVETGAMPARVRSIPWTALPDPTYLAIKTTAGGLPIAVSLPGGRTAADR